MIIREAHRMDVPALSYVARKTYMETFGQTMTPEELSAKLETTRSENYFHSIIETDTILVALMDDRLAGYVQVSDLRYTVDGITVTDRDQAIHAIYVHSDFQGKGIGKALMDTAFQHPRLKAAENVFIDVYEENTRAVTFYHKYGFKDIGKIDVVINGKKVGFDLVLMRPSHK